MAKKEEEKIFAFLCYLISIIGVVIVLATKKDRSYFSIYHAKQGLVLFYNMDNRGNFVEHPIFHTYYRRDYRVDTLDFNGAPVDYWNY